MSLYFDTINISVGLRWVLIAVFKMKIVTIILLIIQDFIKAKLNDGKASFMTDTCGILSLK